MSSRLWLAVAFVLAAGASPARAATDLIAVTLDQAKIVRLPPGAATLIVGNPMIADVTMLKNNNTMVITGKGFGQTNLIAIDAAGSLIEEQEIEVLPSKGLVVLQSGSSRMSYACNPVCMPTVQLGDDDKMFNEAGTQISTRNGYATGLDGREIARAQRPAPVGFRTTRVARPTECRLSTSNGRSRPHPSTGQSRG